MLSADDAVTLTVTDNGIGIGIPDSDTTTPGTPTAVDDDGRPARRGGGLVNMRTRTELCGGTLAIEVPADAGTRIMWRVPLHD
ncbi:ATP-binding protein [Streptomyces sp. NPDC048496]|uniref:ATP-binding protein n=1 Tax=Streptomyces sp. NPDC048496 TaxID=3365558 RepID=UPI003721E7CE